ncbi:hypothetical protein [Halomicrococcus sp. SG-WS-1]|uniref:hypothetical protein n=1 Tax=Halomicrococcus sp. SG-WS-1 TaxID=3439057 RepID=UPI003F7998AD
MDRTTDVRGALADVRVGVERKREVVAVLEESREAVSEGRVALAEGKQAALERRDRLRRRVAGVQRAVELLQQNGGDADLRDVLAALGGRPEAGSGASLPPQRSSDAERSRPTPSRSA